MLDPFVLFTVLDALAAVYSLIWCYFYAAKNLAQPWVECPATISIAMEIVTVAYIQKRVNSFASERRPRDTVAVIVSAIYSALCGLDCIYYFSFYTSICPEQYRHVSGFFEVYIAFVIGFRISLLFFQAAHILERLEKQLEQHFHSDSMKFSREIAIFCQEFNGITAVTKFMYLAVVVLKVAPRLPVAFLCEQDFPIYLNGVIHVFRIFHLVLLFYRGEQTLRQISLIRRLALRKSHLKLDLKLFFVLYDESKHIPTFGNAPLCLKTGFTFFGFTWSIAVAIYQITVDRLSATARDRVCDY